MENLIWGLLISSLLCFLAATLLKWYNKNVVEPVDDDLTIDDLIN